MDIEDVRKNTKLMIDGTPYNIEDTEFMKPGKGRAIYRLKLRNLVDGSTIDRTYHSSEKVDVANTISLEEQYLYEEGDHYVFMNTETFEQHFIDRERLGGKKDFLKDGMVVTMLMLSDQPLDITLPNFVELEVIQTGMATKTATITPQTKSATLETGYSIGVPGFIKEGDVLKVDTRTGTYVERVVNRKS